MDSDRPLGPDLVEAVLDVEQAPGVWVRVTALLGEPQPEVGIHRPTVRYISAAREGGELVALTSEEIAALGARFERAYYRWRGKARGDQSGG